MLKLAPSLLAADFKRLEEQVQTVERAGAEYLHLDVMDGAFVPSISFGMPVIQSLRSCTGLVFDVHMMVEEPGRYVDVEHSLCQRAKSLDHRHSEGNAGHKGPIHHIQMNILGSGLKYSLNLLPQM